MAQIDLLKRLVETLDRAGIAYMLTGSYSSSFHGQRRSTHDIDVVADLSWRDLDAILGAFRSPDFYLDEPAARSALASGGMFNVLDRHEGEKIDFWMLRETPFDESRFARRIKVAAWGFTAYVASAEDTIIQKLHWSAECGGSEKQLDDARQVLRTQRALLDYAYIQKWAERLGVDAAWRNLLAEQ